jgi:hypothetical protein
MSDPAYTFACNGNTAAGDERALLLRPGRQTGNRRRSERTKGDAMASTKRVEIGWEGDDGEPMRVICSVGEAQPEIRYGDSAQPGYSGEVEILRVVEDKVGGLEREDLIPVVEKCFDTIRDRAIEQAADDEDDARSAADDHAIDAARDERRFGC